MNLSVGLSKTQQKKRALAIAIACSSLLILPSCIPSLRHPEPGPNLPESFNGATSSENSAEVTIEEFFNDPMLTNLIHQALAGNQELRILAEEVQIASNEILARQGAYLPFVYLGATAGLTRYSRYVLEQASILNDPIFPPRTFLPNPLPNFLLGPTFLWTPDIWGQLHNAKDAAAMRYFAAGEGRNYVVTRVVAEIADSYYELIALDKRLENLNNIIELQERALEIAQARMAAARGSALAVQRFQAEVRKNQSQKLILYQDIIQVENRINFLAGRFPQPVERMSANLNFIDLNLHALSLGVPPQLLQNRPDIRQAERELAAAGLDVQVARKRFYPQGLITAGVGYQAFNPRYLFITPEAIAGQVVGNLLTPFINRKAIKADYFSANARQLQAVYNFQRVVLNAFTEVINRVSKVENYRKSIEVKKQQVEALEAAVAAATSLFLNPRAGVAVDYLDVLTAQRDLFDARRDLIDTKQQQLSAIVNTYQALGGGAYLSPILIPQPLQPHHWWKHFGHSKASATADRGPQPLPAPAAAGRSPVPPPTPAAETNLEPLPTPMGGGNGSGTGSNTKDPPR